MGGRAREGLAGRHPNWVVYVIIRTDGGWALSIAPGLEISSNTALHSQHLATNGCGAFGQSFVGFVMTRKIAEILRVQSSIDVPFCSFLLQ